MFILSIAALVTLTIKLRYQSLEKIDNSVDSILGQGVVNHLRDSCAVSNLPSVFGKFKHLLLSRDVVSPGDVLGSIHPFSREVLRSPEKLSSISAVISTDIKKSVTLTSSFSCVDRGKSDAESLQWWVANFDTFEELKELKKDVGGAENISQKLDGSTTDIVQKCWERQVNQTTDLFRLVEHAGIHDGKGVYFTPFDETNSPKGPIIPTAELFFRMYDLRRSASEKDEVVYDTETKIPLATGLAFDTGFRIRTPESISDTDINSNYRVPATPIMALRSTVGARLEESNVAPGEAPTNRTILILSIVSTGLPLVLASWLVFKFIADGASMRFEDLRSRGVNAVIEGHRTVRKIDYAQHVMIIVEFFAGLVLLAPLLLAVFDGSANPSKKVEVSSGVSVFYGSSQKSMSDDLSNPVAGAPFVVTTWIRMRDLGSGFNLSFTVTLLVVIFIAFLISMHELKRLNCIMPSYDFQNGGFSSMKTIGSFFMWFKSRGRNLDSVKIYKVLVQFRDDIRFDNAYSVRPLVNVSEGFRRENRKYKNENAQITFNRELNEECSRLVQHLNEECSTLEAENTLSLVATVKLTNRTRRSAVLCKSEFYFNNLPRWWYYVLGSDVEDGEKMNNIEMYRTNGVFPPDQYLVIARLGLLEYLADVKSVEVMQDHSKKRQSLDSDGCKVSIVETKRLNTSQQGFVSTEHDVGVKVDCLREGDNRSRLLLDLDLTSTAASSSVLSFEKKTSKFQTKYHEHVKILFDV